MNASDDLRPTASERPVHGLVRAAGRPAEVVAFDDSVVGFFVEAADLLGVPKSVAAIYGICFASPTPLSFSEIDERLELSAGSISQGLKVLKEVGALRVAEADGQMVRRSDDPSRSSDQTIRPTPSLSPRAARYEPDLELRKLVMHWLEQRLQKQIDAGAERLKDLLSRVPANSAPVRARLEHLQNWNGKSRALLPVAKAFLKLT